MLKKTLLQNMSATTTRCNETVRKPYNFVKQLLIMLQFKGARLSRNNVGDIKVFLRCFAIKKTPTDTLNRIYLVENLAFQRISKYIS